MIIEKKRGEPWLSPLLGIGISFEFDGLDVHYVANACRIKEVEAELVEPARPEALADETDRQGMPLSISDQGLAYTASLGGIAVRTCADKQIAIIGLLAVGGGNHVLDGQGGKAGGGGRSTVVENDLRVISRGCQFGGRSGAVVRYRRVVDGIETADACSRVEGQGSGDGCATGIVTRACAGIVA